MRQRLAPGVTGIVLFGILAGTAAFAGEYSTLNGNRIADTLIMTRGRTANSFAGELYSDVMGSSIAVQREFRRVLPSISGYSGTTRHLGRASHMCTPGKKWVMWDAPFSIRETRKIGGGSLGYNRSVSGFATGVNYMPSDTGAVGVAVGYDYRKLDGRDRYHMRNRADTFHAAVFGGYNTGSFFLDIYAGYSRSWNRSERHLYLGNSPSDWREAAGNFNDTVLSAGIKTGKVWVLPGGYRLIPSAGVDFSQIRFSGLSETGSIYGLRIGKSTYSNADIPLMVSLNKTYSAGFLRFGGDYSLLTPEVRGGYVPRIGAKRATTNNEFMNAAGRPVIRIKSAKLTESYATLGTGVKIKVRDRFIFSADYNYAFVPCHTSSHSLTAMLGVSY